MAVTYQTWIERWLEDNRAYGGCAESQWFDEGVEQGATHMIVRESQKDDDASNLN